VLIAVCEDQKNDRQLLLEYLNTELERLRICAEILSYESGEALLAAAQKLSFQIYFLDIFMVKTNGVDTARALRARGTEAAIVFVTSSRDYFAEGFEVGAVHYLVKPYKKTDVRTALERCIKQVGKAECYIEIMVNREKRKILLSELIWAESNDKVCWLHLKTEDVRSYIHLDELQQLLSDPRFLRCHRSFLINMDLVNRVDKNFFYTIDDAEIPMRQAERARMRENYESYLFEKMRRRD